MERWKPEVEISRAEEFVFKRLGRHRKLFAFLRVHRTKIFDDAFQAELDGMYRQTGAGDEPLPAAFMAMVTLLQGYSNASDAEAVELSVMDRRWQLVLGNLNDTTPPFSQGALQKFRQRLIEADMDRRVLERTIEIAKATKEFDWKKLPKSLRMGIDSRPLSGAGRVEDTFNLLGHAARKLAEAAAKLTERTLEEVCRLAKIPLLLSASVKSGLDIDWNDPEQKDEALNTLQAQIASLHEWVEKKLGSAVDEDTPVRRYIEAIAQVQKQDLEDAAPGRKRIRQGVAEDRRVSIEDPEMRHGRKSKSKRFNGYKEHIATDLDTRLVYAGAVTPANVPEEEGAPMLKDDLDHQGIKIGELSIDRAYVNSPTVAEVRQQGGEILCKPWRIHGRPGCFSKTDFKINMRDRTITCPAGQIENFEPGDVVEFDPEVCGPCPMRGQCTHSASGKGRQVKIADDEALQQRLRKQRASRSGRQALRRRTAIEHSLAHIAAREGPKARYRGARKNLFNLRRSAALQNLETIQQTIAIATV